MSFWYRSDGSTYTRWGQGGGLTVERFLVGHVIDKEDAHRAAVVCSCDRTEAFLTGRVPNLQFHSLAIQLDGANFEIDSDRGDERRGEGVFAESQETARLSDT
jgi:hypothetical protein